MKFLKDLIYNRIHISPFILIIVTTIFALAVSLYYLHSGLTIIFQNLFYVPIIIACMYYTKKGFVFSAILSIIYLNLILIFNNNSEIIIGALIHVFIFVGVAGITTLLSIKLEQAKEELRESKDQYQQLFEQAPYGIGIATLDGNILTSNRTMELITGFSKEDFKKINLTDTYVNPHDRAKIIEIVKKSGIVIDYPVMLKRKDGTEYFASITIGITNIAGKDLLQTQVQNITERKRAEDALRENEERLKIAGKASYDFLYEWDVANNNIEWFGDIDSSLGYKGGTISRDIKVWLSLIHPEDREQLENAVELHRTKTDPINYEYRIKHNDGSCRHWKDHALPMINKDGHPYKWIGVCTDITERKQAEEALRANRKQLTDIIDFLPDATLVIDKERRIIIWNKAIEKMTGIPAAEMIGKDGYIYTIPFYGEARKSLMDLVFEDSKEIEARYNLITREGDNILAEVFCNTLYENRGAWIFAIASPLYDQSGNIIGAIESIRDITDRKRAEEALQESEEKLHSITNNSPDLILMLNLQYEIIFINHTFTMAREQIHGKSVFDFIPLEFQLAATTCFKEVLKTGKPSSYGMEHRFINGSVKYFESVVGPIIHNGMIIALVINARDITERKQVEEALFQEHNFITQIMETSPVGITTVDVDGRITFANSKAVTILGLSKDEIFKMTYNSTEWHITDFNGNPFPDEQLPFNLVITTGKSVFNIQHAIRRQDGKRIMLSVNGVPITDVSGNVTGMVSTIEDITARKQAEEALLFEKQRSLTLLENAPFGIMLILENGTISYINSKFKDIFGYEPEDIRDGRTWFRRAYPDKEYRHEVISAWKGDLEKSGVGEQRPRIFTVVCKDGSKKIISFVPVMLSTGDHIMACEDITERKRIEEEKRSLEERFARAEKMEALGTLAGGVAHDLNNVLGIIVGYAELLFDEVEKSSPVREHLESIYNGGRKAAAMIEDMLTMARRGVHNRQVVNLNRIIIEGRKSPEFMRLSSQLSSVKIKEALDPDLLNISGSPVHLAKTLFNLILNAFEAMPNGGILTISTYNQYLEKPVKGYDEVRSGDYVVLSVSDTGTGIKSADLKRIFEPFYTKKIMGRSGTGLGLAVVWSTVKDHNGYIDVQSEEEKGSIFMLYFPVSREEMIEEDVSVMVTEYMGKGESILVVDDVKGQRDLAVEMLKKLNYNISSVSSGEEAVDCLKDNAVDLIVLDMIMEPGMDGLDTYKKILEIRPQQKAIIVSGFSETDRVEQAQALGAGAYVKKPYVLEKLGLAAKKELERIN